MVSLVKRAGSVSVPLLVVSACSSPLSALNPAGPAADAISILWWIFLIGAGVLTLFVMCLIAISFGGPRQVSERRWTVGLGVGFSLVILSGLLVSGIAVGERLLPKEDAIVVHAHARQWSWTFSQPGPGGVWVETERDLHIPAGQPVDVRVTSGDVIHSFWVPRLAGKIDAIPGRENVLRIEADRPGIYEGRCAEFCGLGYSGHRFRVIAHSLDDWPESIPLIPAEEAE
ncbi:MAG: cytochrome c oxidase subunit II [Alphaproteobacteria bacterium HGW-Alphaproteobacteria-18]|nr:MAG: cytochrome c oxidase subunit II [Alphaproteobacteria bacterium HGW-Alphaproteobacteria-18]